MDILGKIILCVHQLVKQVKLVDQFGQAGHACKQLNHQTQMKTSNNLHYLACAGHAVISAEKSLKSKASGDFYIYER